MDKSLPTKQQVTKKLIWGAALIVASLVIGKLVLIPVIFYPASNNVRLLMLAIYVFSWVMLIPGFLLAGVEGYRLVNHRYKDLKTRTFHQMRDGGVMAAKVIRRGAELPIRATKTAARTIKRGVSKKKGPGDGLTFLSQK